jgi:hypothetical protein
MLIWEHKYSLIIPGVDATWSCVASFTTRPLYPLRKTHVYSLVRRLGAIGKREKYAYTDWAMAVRRAYLQTVGTFELGHAKTSYGL